LEDIVNNDATESKTIVVTGRENVLAVRALAIRRGLKLECETGMVMSSRYSTMNVAKGVCGSTKRTKRGVYADLDAWIVENLDMPSAPLKPKK
jgi:hypothetical protein